MKTRYVRKRNHYTMLRPKVPVKKMYWEFHKGDNDNLPSVPHGHSLDGKYKLEIWSGKIYNIQSGKLEYIAKKKDMKALQNYPGFMEFVKECREDYMERNPAIVLPKLVATSRRRLYYQRIKEKSETIIVETRVNKV